MEARHMNPEDVRSWWSWREFYWKPVSHDFTFCLMMIIMMIFMFFPSILNPSGDHWDHSVSRIEFWRCNTRNILWLHPIHIRWFSCVTCWIEQCNMLTDGMNAWVMIMKRGKDFDARDDHDDHQHQKRRSTLDSSLKISLFLSWWTKRLDESDVWHVAHVCDSRGDGGRWIKRSQGHLLFKRQEEKRWVDEMMIFESDIWNVCRWMGDMKRN